MLFGDFVGLHFLSVREGRCTCWGGGECLYIIHFTISATPPLPLGLTFVVCMELPVGSVNMEHVHS